MNHGFQCPECKQGDSLFVSARVTAALLPDGCDTGDSDTDWDEKSRAWCGCGWLGTVADLGYIELERTR